ncbi:hypothetical protein SAMN03159512_05293 [Pseudomonas sp. NFR09]|nr:hypothetical protein SAMN03159512_05293 [Pseudomonas sp. NFR09]
MIDAEAIAQSVPGAGARIYGDKRRVTVALATADRQTGAIQNTGDAIESLIQTAWPGRFAGLARLLLKPWYIPFVRGTVR